MAHPARSRIWWIVAAAAVFVALLLSRVFGTLLRVLGGG